MKTILFLSHSASLTGAPFLVHDIASRLDKQEFHVEFIIGEDGPLIEKFRQLGPTHIDPIYPDEVKYWRELKRIRKRFQLLRRIRPDLMFCNTIHPAKWLAYARVLRIPTITHVLELARGFDTLGIVEHQLVRRCSNRIIAASDAVKQYLVEYQGIDAQTIRVVHAGIDLQRFDGTPNSAELRKQLGLTDAVVIGTVGRITYVKGSDLFLRLANRLKTIAPPSLNLKFLVVATTADKEFVKKFNDLLKGHQLSSDVVVVENVPETAGYFSVMDIYVSTAREDPFPVVVLEAMAARKPVAGFAVGGIPEAVTPECGVLVHGDDVAALAKEVSSLIIDVDRRTKLGDAGRKRVEEKFTLNRYASDVERIIGDMIPRRRETIPPCF